MGVELVMGEINRGGVNHDIDRPGPSSGIEIDSTSGFLKGASPRRETPEMIHFEAGVRMIRIHAVSCGGTRCGGSQYQERQRVSTSHSY